MSTNVRKSMAVLHCNIHTEHNRTAIFEYFLHDDPLGKTLSADWRLYGAILSKSSISDWRVIITS